MDWKAGDLALCIQRGVWRIRNVDGSRGAETAGPRSGAVLTVRSVEMGTQEYLRFREWPSNEVANRFASLRFRKINPLTDEEQDAFYRDLLEPREPPPVKNPKELV